MGTSKYSPFMPVGVVHMCPENLINSTDVASGCGRDGGMKGDRKTE